MPENKNKENFKKFLIKEFFGIDYNSQSRKFAFSRSESVSVERRKTVIEKGEKNFMLSWQEAEDAYKQVMTDLPVKSYDDTCYSFDLTESKPGDIFRFELSEEENLAYMELMTVSSKKMLVLKSSDSGLLQGDIIMMDNTFIRTKGRIICSVEGDQECKGKWYKSMPITLIKRIIPPLAHQALGNCDISIGGDDEIENGDCVNIHKEVMGILMGKWSNKASSYLKIREKDYNTAELSNGTVMKKGKNIGEWYKKES